MTKTTYQTLVLKNGTAYWAKTSEADLEGNFSMDLAGLDKLTLKTLKSLGIKIKNKDKENALKNEEDGKNRKTDIGDFVSLKSKFPPQLKDSHRNLLLQTLLIGNGSIVNVEARPYDWNFKGKSGTALGLQQIQIVKLEEFPKGSKDLFEVLEDSTDAIGNTLNDDQNNPF